MSSIYFLKFPLIPTLGGAETHTLQLARHYASQGHKIKLISSDQHLFRLFEKCHLPRRRMFMGWEPTSKCSLLLWPLTWLIARYKLRKIIQHAPADSVFFCQSLTEKLILTPHLVMEEFSVLFPSLEVRGSGRVKIIWLEHKIPGNWLKMNPLKFLYLRYAKQVKIITVSDFAKQEFARFGVPEKNIEVIYPSISAPATLHPSPGSGEGTPVLWRGEGKFTIGILGRLDPEKGVLDFLKILLPHLPNHPDWSILIAGDGEQKTEIEKLAGKHPQIQILEFIHNLDVFFSQISVLAYPSRVPESFGMAILETLSHGIPVIANNIGAIPEIITAIPPSPPRDGEKGRGLILVNSPIDWIRHLKKLADPSTYKKMSIAPFLTSQTFSEKKMFSAFNKLLN